MDIQYHLLFYFLVFPLPAIKTYYVASGETDQAKDMISWEWYGGSILRIRVH